MVPSSSSSVEPPQHQVFLNFRGKQLRFNFVSHLEKALRNDGINVFIDQKETKGKDLSILFTRIEKSRIALAIFSSQYADSRWCLDELVKIKECVELRKLVAIPIFYKVDTDHVKNLEGEFGDKFWKLAKTTTDGEKIQKWREALKAVPNMTGFTLDERSDEGEFIDGIVGGVIKVLFEISTDPEREIPIDSPCAAEGDRPEAAPDSDPHLFGIETRLMRLEEKLDSECKSTLTIGVVGMPGIGKTALMEMLYKKWQGKFLHYAFLYDVHKMTKGDIMVRNVLMKKLLRDEDLEQEITDLLPETMKALLSKTKSLVVLDNVSHKDQIEDLLGKYDWIKNGSLIFITTSDMSVIEGMVDDTYEVQRLTGRDSLRYFNHFAFSGNLRLTPEGNFMNLSRLFADYAKGNPLALSILGKELNTKDETYWKEKLQELAQSPNKGIQNVLQISYDGLGHLQKDVFLDVACFFRSGDEYYVRCLVESCDTEPIDAVSEIKDLASKFWINISGRRVEMHDLLYTFGKKLGSKDRLCDLKDVVVALKKRTGADSVRGIFLDMFLLKEKLSFDKSTFIKMCSLRYLKFYSSHCHRECEAECKLNFPDGLEFSLDEIRYLYWLKFPLKKLPKDFSPKNLTDLNLPYSEIEEVWEGVKDTPKLKWVDLSHSSKLYNLSGLMNAESLQRLNLEGCTSLEELPREMKCMKSLIFLNMRGCTGLRVLRNMNLISMKTLILTNCSSLQKFQVISNNLETLYLNGTAIDQLPTNIVNLQRLIVLNLKDCKKLRAVPQCLGKLKALQELVLSGCLKLESFPIFIQDMKRLQILLLDGTAIKEMPKILQFHSSKVEDLRKLRSGMNGLSSLRRLCLSRNDMISTLQVDINQLDHLKWLDLKYCKNLTSIPLLPPNLEILDAHGCDKLKTVASPLALLKLMEKVHSKFIFTNCNNLEQAAKNSITSYAQRKSQLDALRCYKEGTVSEALFITCFPGSEVPSWFNHRTLGSALKLKFPSHWCDNRLSTIALCAVVIFPYTKDKINSFSIECTCEFKNELGTCIRFSCTLGGGWIEPRKIDSDHVFISYTSSSHITKHLEGSLESRENHKCVPTEASIEFAVRDGPGEIVNCGLSLVYEEPKHVVVEGNCNGTSSRREVSIGESILSFAAGYLSTVLRFMWLGVVFFMVYGFARFFFVR